MKILVLSVKAGMGHHRTGMAIQNYLTDHGCESTMINALDYISLALSKTVDKGYIVATKYASHAWATAYGIALNQKKTTPNAFKDAISKPSSAKLLKYIEEYKPDAIVCTHIFAALLVTFFKRKCNLNVLSYGIMTDLTRHPFWQDTDMDFYVTPSQTMHLQLEKCGMDTKKLLPFGIPIDEKFSRKLNKEDARAQLGFEDKPTLLIMLGSMGYGKLTNDLKILDKMKEDFQIVCVCGSNKKLKRKIEKRTWNKTVHCLGFVDNVDLLMDAADILITKPGGLTTAESFAKGLPTVIINPIPGLEERNAEFLLNLGLVIRATKTFPIDEAVYQILQQGWRSELLNVAIENISRPNAVQDLYNHILEHLNL